MGQEIASRELRNDTAGVLRRVEAGESVTVTVNGRPVAELVPVQRHGQGPVGGAELFTRLRTAQADAGLRHDLARLAGETTDDLGPIS
ncbi:type II toxin-antitoxin system Phd/YefM family antitoxin [Pseudonocardia sp. GCM10023141]|uniref:type II toxin-antitoxin system Phd/YefM family antitoxin n=1 Tax=Pseudonocardia sp. GCM10023141 TaxID=3252653 RepID=UPI003609930A